MKRRPGLYSSDIEKLAAKLQHEFNHGTNYNSTSTRGCYARGGKVSSRTSEMRMPNVRTAMHDRVETSSRKRAPKQLMMESFHPFKSSNPRGPHGFEASMTMVRKVPKAETGSFRKLLSPMLNMQDGGKVPSVRKSMVKSYADGGLERPSARYKKEVGFSQGGKVQCPENRRIKTCAKKMERMGRNGDTMLAHINPEEARMLKAMGGRGSINPRTGLREYRDDKDGRQQERPQNEGSNVNRPENLEETKAELRRPEPIPADQQPLIFSQNQNDQRIPVYFHLINNHSHPLGGNARQNEGLNNILASVPPHQNSSSLNSNQQSNLNRSSLLGSTQENDSRKREINRQIEESRNRQNMSSIQNVNQSSVTNPISNRDNLEYNKNLYKRLMDEGDTRSALKVKNKIRYYKERLSEENKNINLINENRRNMNIRQSHEPQHRRVMRVYSPGGTGHDVDLDSDQIDTSSARQAAEHFMNHQNQHHINLGYEDGDNIWTRNRDNIHKKTQIDLDEQLAKKLQLKELEPYQHQLNEENENVSMHGSNRAPSAGSYAEMIQEQYHPQNFETDSNYRTIKRQRRNSGEHPKIEPFEPVFSGSNQQQLSPIQRRSNQEEAKTDAEGNKIYGAEHHKMLNKQRGNSNDSNVSMHDVNESFVQNPVSKNVSNSNSVLGKRGRNQDKTKLPGSRSSSGSSVPTIYSMSNEGSPVRLGEFGGTTVKQINPAKFFKNPETHYRNMDPREKEILTKMLKNMGGRISSAQGSEAKRKLFNNFSAQNLKGTHDVTLGYAGDGNAGNSENSHHSERLTNEVLRRLYDKKQAGYLYRNAEHRYISELKPCKKGDDSCQNWLRNKGDKGTYYVMKKPNKKYVEKNYGGPGRNNTNYTAAKRDYLSNPNNKNGRLKLGTFDTNSAQAKENERNAQNLVRQYPDQVSHEYAKLIFDPRTSATARATQLARIEAEFNSRNKAQQKQAEKLAKKNSKNKNSGGNASNSTRLSSNPSDSQYNSVFGQSNTVTRQLNPLEMSLASLLHPPQPQQQQQPQQSQNQQSQQQIPQQRRRSSSENRDNNKKGSDKDKNNKGGR